MSAKITVDEHKGDRLRPFVLKWAETAPESLLWSHRSVFSPTVNGLDVYMATETDKCETTGTTNETADSTKT
jgi:hypothetical protein